MGRRIVITGSTGIIGIALVQYAIESGDEVLVITRPNSKNLKKLISSDNLHICEGELSSLNRLEAVGEYDVFYHLAWEGTDKSGRDDVSIQYKNIAYTLDAVKLAHKLKCKTFVGVGSQAEYGRYSGTMSADMPVDPDSAYGIAKYTAGRLATLMCESLSIKHVWGRVFSVYGIHDSKSTLIMYCIDSLLQLKKPILTPCEQLWDYLYCEDAAKALYLLGEKGKNKKIYNIGSGIAQPLEKYIYTIRELINPELPLGIAEKNYAEKQVMHLCADITELTKDTGFIPITSFQDGIIKTIDWYSRECGLERGRLFNK